MLSLSLTLKMFELLWLNEFLALLYYICKMFIVLKILRCFMVCLSILSHGVAPLYSTISTLVEIKPAYFNERGIVNKSVQAIKAESIQIVIDAYYFPRSLRLIFRICFNIFQLLFLEIRDIAFNHFFGINE